MSEQQSLQDPKVYHLEELFNRVKPKSRYISQSHVEEWTNSIAKEIVNGDIEVRKVRGNLDLPEEKRDFEEMMRRKFMDQFEKQKEELEHRLGYIENSLVHLDRYDFLKRRSMNGSLGSSRKSEEWRKQHEEEMKKIEQKKKQIAERSKEKEVETEQLRAKIMEEEKARKKAQLLQSIKKVRERTEKRTQSARQQKERLKELLSRKELFQKLEERYHQKQENILEERKKKLAEIRQLKPHINFQEIIEHEQKVLDILKQKEAMRNKQLRMMSSRTQSYRPSYQSAFYKQFASPHEQETQENPKQKLEKMRQFSEQVKSKYVPEIDEIKRKQMEERLQQQAKARMQREQRQKQLMQKSKLKGMEYLQFVKRMPKKKDESVVNGPKTDRIAYKNYLGSVSVDMGRPKPWNALLSKGQNKVETAQLLQFQSQKLQQKLKRKQEYDRALKIKDDGSIDQQYYQMVKAKLNLLAKQ